MMKRHILTVLVEDYFQVGAFQNIIKRDQWYRFETRLERNTLQTLELLDRHQIKATFFVLGWIADSCPEVVREIVRRGHEVANRGYYHRGIRTMSPPEFRDDLRRSGDAIQRVTGMPVRGYRIAEKWFSPGDLWALDILAEEGYAYDSSLVPRGPSFRSEPHQRFVYEHRSEGKSIWELPISTSKILGWQFPIAGGNYFRQLPHTAVKELVAKWDRTHEEPFVMYFHVWELDADQVRINASSLATLRHYRNLGKLNWVMADYFRTYRFTGIGEYLGLEDVHKPAEALKAPRVSPIEISSPVPAEPAAQPSGPLKPVTIVVPCYNEEHTLPYLSNTLKSVESTLAHRYEVHFLLVDDHSSDETWAEMNRIFGTRPNYRLVRHERNRGVSAAIMTGLQNAVTDVVCSIDCDCSYDPHELLHMIPLLETGVDLVTASPYHPGGRVKNVPGWRLALSQTASRMYQFVLRERLFTYTSCFRVYRRSAVAGLRMENDGFLGIAEMIWKLNLQGSEIAEYPATLEVRLLGHSKMKVFHSVAGHAGLMLRLLRLRLLGLFSRPLRYQPVPQPGSQITSPQSK